MDSSVQLTFYNAESGTSSGPPEHQKREIKEGGLPLWGAPFLPMRASACQGSQSSSIILPSASYFCQRLPAPLAFMIQSTPMAMRSGAGCLSPSVLHGRIVSTGYSSHEKLVLPFPKDCYKCKGISTSWPITIRNVCTCTLDAKLRLSTETTLFQCLLSHDSGVSLRLVQQSRWHPAGQGLIPTGANYAGRREKKNPFTCPVFLDRSTPRVTGPVCGRGTGFEGFS
jgi:hypothetical protein